MNRDIYDAQDVLKKTHHYSGKVDGFDGPLTQAALKSSENGEKIDGRWKTPRRAIAAMQRELKKSGHNPGVIDGLRGKNTEAALDAFRKNGAVKNQAPKDFVITKDSSVIIPKFVVPLRRDTAAMIAAYGQPGDKNPDNTAGRVELPFSFTIAWNKSQKVSRFSAHKKTAPVFESIFKEAAREYGEADFRRLGLDLFGGCYNARTMRGGSAWSTHAWGIAVDLDPERNQLKWTKARAQFAKPDYVAFWKIVEAHGCVSLGRARDYDWMHFQLAKE